MAITEQEEKRFRSLISIHIVDIQKLLDNFERKHLLHDFELLVGHFNVAKGYLNALFIVDRKLFYELEEAYKFTLAEAESLKRTIMEEHKKNKCKV